MKISRFERRPTDSPTAPLTQSLTTHSGKSFVAYASEHGVAVGAKYVMVMLNNQELWRKESDGSWLRYAPAGETAGETLP